VVAPDRVEERGGEREGERGRRGAGRTGSQNGGLGGKGEAILLMKHEGEGGRRLSGGERREPQEKTTVAVKALKIDPGRERKNQQ
jgi:hypothetical protein